MKIVGQLVVGPNEKYLEETLKEFARLCDDVIVATCNATAREIKLLNKYDFRHYEDNREWGRHQPSIKTDLLTSIHRLGADWILVLDSDETLPSIKARKDLEHLANSRESVQVYVTNLWNDAGHYSKTLSFWNVRFYKSDPSKGVQFLKKPVHCGNAPPYFYSLPAKATYVPHILLHKGLMDPADRARKAERYALYDPDARHKGREYYDALTSEGSGSEYVEADVLNKINEFCKKL